MTIKDLYGRYNEVPVSAETWTQLYNAGLIRNNVLDLNQMRGQTYGYDEHSNFRNGNARDDQDYR